MTDDLVLPTPCLVVLVGPSGSGKSTWAAAHFPAAQIVSSDALRAVVGDGEHDISASTDALALLEQIVELRVKRRLTTVVDTLGLDPERRARWRALARANDVPVVCVAFESTLAEARARNRDRGKTVPDRVLSPQHRQFREQRAALDAEGYGQVIAPTTIRTAPATVARTTALAGVQAQAPVGLRFGLQIPVFDWPGGPVEMRARLREIGEAAERAGFASLWVMDHFRQIPMFGGAWLDMPESYTTLAYLAACTERVQLGTLVTGVTYRNVAHLGKIVATLDVLSGGRAVCGIGLGWFEAEHRAYGWNFPSVRERYALLEDALQLLPLVWDKGNPAFRGAVLDVPEAMCYPRPLQEHVPILVGGNGERHTLRLAARYADACNIIGEREVVARKVAALHRHCDAAQRDRAAVAVTQLSTTLVGRHAADVAQLIDAGKPNRQSADRYAGRVNAGTVSDQIGRFRALADAGVNMAIVSLPNLGRGGAIERFADVVDAFA